MARRRKTEAKEAPVKQPTQPLAVRKSSRQRAKKQIEEQKLNGDVSSSTNNSEDCKDSNDESSQEAIKKINSVPKKSVKNKNMPCKDKSTTENESDYNKESVKQDCSRSTVSPPIETLELVEENQINDCENTLSEVAWPEEVIEETIICEEMEVEADLTGACSINHEGNLLEQVLFMNDATFEDKNIIEYTVVQSEDGTESMVVSSDNIENITSVSEFLQNPNNCQTIEQELSVLHVSETKESKQVIESVEHHESITNLESDIPNEICSVDDHFTKSEIDDCKLSKTLTKDIKSTRTRRSTSALVYKSVKKESDGRRKRSELSAKPVTCVESKVLNVSKKDKSVKSKKTNIAESNNENEQINTQSSTDMSQETVTITQDDNSSSMSDKMDFQEIPVTDTIKDNTLISTNSAALEKKSNVSHLDCKSDTLNYLVSKSKNLMLSNEEHSRDSVVDGKVDFEDAKVSSSSENSNDTLSSINSCKVSEFNVDNKNTINNVHESEKKVEFRSRSGSTDTTESESGSNSSGVRRSSRIRTIGLMNKRSRGHGLVTKPVDPTKNISHQEREKTINSGSGISQEKDSNQCKDYSDNNSETQSDKENSSNKTIPQDIVMSLINTTGTTGYDSDSNKPVKVKSRWRRSSELEMSNSGSWSTSRPNLNFSNTSISGTSTGNTANVLSDANNLSSLPLGLPQESNAVPDCKDVTSSLIIHDLDDVSVTPSNLSTNLPATVIPKTIGAKISLSMVPEIADREMEERLSQFEHLKENLYLTERYTNKETKRMLCDCFLTEEEIQRGELGCGEDCLNRLLMMECGPRCVVGDRCTNRRFQNSEYANCEVFRTEKKGFGLRATTDLYPGDFIMEYVGEVVDPKDFRRRAKEYSKDKNRHYYFMALKSDQIIDATMKGNVSRFINHSCDPNAETQKWTVNGELRIGFFSKKFVANSEEITFDYHFQRYGKEAQKCYCEASNCRGWIGDNKENKAIVKYVEGAEDMEHDSEEDVEEEEEEEEEEEGEEEEDNKENKDTEKPLKKVRRRRREKKKDADHMEDEDLEEMIDKLCATGLRNRVHTLDLSRLIVRSREMQHRARLLKVIQSGEQPCRRLFLDYHGLRLLWGYMKDVAEIRTEEAQQLRLEILKTLSTLPIPNRTMLIDSKVLSVVENWSKQLYNSSSGDSPEDDQSKLKSNSEDVEMEQSVKNGSLNATDGDANVAAATVTIKQEAESGIKTEIKTEVNEQSAISEAASNLLLNWSNLKEVFRIPKKERLEQMKEHEREADRGYKEEVLKETKEASYERHRSDKYNRNDPDKRLDRRRGRDSPEFEHSRPKDKRVLEERPNLVQVPRMTKYERRQLFAMKVAKEEEERQRRQQEDSWQQHEAQCLALGLDPFATAAFDPQTGYPLFFNPQLGQWQPFPIQENAAELGQQCTPAYANTSGLAAPAQLFPPSFGPLQMHPLHNGALPAFTEQEATTAAATPSGGSLEQAQPQPELTAQPPPVLDLPPKWKWARDKRGRLYYYHAKERVSQWLPPPPEHIGVQPDSSSSSDSSDESSSSNEEEEEAVELEQQQQEQLVESMEVDVTPKQVAPETKKRRDGLVQERIISPRREEDRVDHKKYKEIKEKLRRQKERAKLKEQFEKMKKHRRSSKSKSHTKHNSSKFQPITSDMSPTMERKIKDTFRINMANVMVHFLNPYRKSDCKQGRITNTEDFKHLARKLTHFVLAKELKHCKSVDELECNDNVKHKAKDFVRKYMSKFGEVYQKSTDED